MKLGITLPSNEVAEQLQKQTKETRLKNQADLKTKYLTNKQRKQLAKAQQHTKKFINYQETDQFKKSLDSLLNVSSKSIQAKVESIKQTQDNFRTKLESLIIANKPEFKIFHQIMCNKSGQLISTLPQDYFHDLLKIHDEKQALSILAKTSLGHYHAQLIDSSSQALNKLLSTNPVAYWIQAASFIYQHKQTNTQYSELSDYVPGLLSQEDYFNICFLHDKHKAFNQLQTIWAENPSLVIESCELLRKLLGLAQTNQTMSNAFYFADNLLSASNNQASLKLFVDCTKRNLKFLIQKHFDKLRNKSLETQQKLFKINQDEINQIHKKLKGRGNYHKQSKIKNHTTNQSIMLELQEFIINEFDNNSDNSDGLNGLDDIAEIDFSDFSLDTDEDKINPEFLIDDNLLEDIDFGGSMDTEKDTGMDTRDTEMNTRDIDKQQKIIKPDSKHIVAKSKGLTLGVKL